MELKPSGASINYANCVDLCNLFALCFNGPWTEGFNLHGIPWLWNISRWGGNFSIPSGGTFAPVAIGARRDISLDKDFEPKGKKLAYSHVGKSLTGMLQGDGSKVNNQPVLWVLDISKLVFTLDVVDGSIINWEVVVSKIHRVCLENIFLGYVHSWVAGEHTCNDIVLAR
eukprot:5998243-Ditylum_brightwellii.AAC.1